MKILEDRFHNTYVIKDKVLLSFIRNNVSNEGFISVEAEIPDCVE